MKQFLPISALASLSLAVTAAAGPAAAANTPLIQRGRYLAHGSALCIDCHSPRDERGQFQPDRHLTGAPIPFVPAASMPWAPAAPAIAGLEGWTDAQAIRFLMTGERPSGVPPRPPMPPYRLNRADAEALVAYLRSLKPGSDR